MLERDNRDALSEQQQIYPSLLFLSLRWAMHRNWTWVWRCWIGQCKLLVNLKREQDEDHHPRQLPGGEDHYGPGAAQGDWARSRLLHRKCKWETARLCHIIIAQRTDGFGGRGNRGEYFSLSMDSLSLLDFLFLVQLYSNQGVSCRNIGQEQLRVTQSCGARQTMKNTLFGFNLNGPLNHGKEGKTR